MNKKINQFVRKHFELNSRQANVFLLLALLSISLIAFNIFSSKHESTKVAYELSYFIEDSAVVTKVKTVLKEDFKNKNFNKKKQPVFKKEVIEIGDINSVTPDQLTSISGVGSVLSKRIVKFRDALGGFYSLDQLYEVYGLDSVVVKRIIESSTLEDKVEFLDVNLSGYNDFKSHPYLSWEQASEIIKLRRKNIFLNQDDVLFILDSVDFLRVKPYLIY